MEQKFLTDKVLKQIDTKEFKKKIGITKSDYCLLRNLMLQGIDPRLITIWKSSKGANKLFTLHQFCRELRNIDVIYLTRSQKERRPLSNSLE